MKRIIYFALGILTCCWGCTDKFESYNTNPNTTSNATSSLLATDLILSTMDDVYGLAMQKRNRLHLYDDMLSKYITYKESVGYSYNLLGRASYTDLYMEKLNNVGKMVGYAKEGGMRNSYEGVGHVLRALKFFDLTMRVGDIPYSEAMQGESGIQFPAYDTQKEVILGLLDELEKADALLAEGAAFAGDPVYDGDPQKWRKAANSMSFKILINLYNKTSDSDLNVKGRMQALLGKPIFTSNDDNLQLKHSSDKTQWYPFYEDGNNYIDFVFLSSTLVDSLKAYGDRRLFYYAEPAVNKASKPAEWDSYQGIDPVIPFASVQDQMISGDYSMLNKRYYKDPKGEPTYVLSYSELNFILAEAAVRGLISGSAKSYYDKGVRAAMEFVSDNTAAAYNHGMVLDDAYITSYLSGGRGAFPSSSQAQIKQIIVQKYLSEFLQAPFNAWYEYRRTGYPELEINPSTNENIPSTKMPVRWMYPDDEYTYNSENVKAAVDRQFGGNDDNNQVMWILQ